MDNETQKVFLRQKSLRDLLNVEGWKIAMEIKERMFKELMDIRQFPDDILKVATKLKSEIELRKNTIALFEDWLKKISGEAEMFDTNFATDAKEKEELIVRS